MEKEHKKEEHKPKAEEKKKSKIERQIIILFGILIIVLIAAVITFNLMAPKAYFDYGPFKVFKQRLSGTTVDYYYIPFKTASSPVMTVALRNDPRTLNNVSLNVDEKLWTNISKVWISSDPNISYGVIPAGEIGRFTTALGLNTSYAFDKNSGTYAQIDCSNATSNTRVVDIRVENETRVYSQDYCIIMTGMDDTALTKASDKLVLTWLQRLASYK